MGNVRFPQYGRPKNNKATADGFMLGVFTIADMFRDRYDVTDDQVKELVVESIGMMLAYATGEYNPRYRFRELEKRLGITLEEITGGYA